MTVQQIERRDEIDYTKARGEKKRVVLVMVEHEG